MAWASRVAEQDEAEAEAEVEDWSWESFLTVDPRVPTLPVLDEPLEEPMPRVFLHRRIAAGPLSARDGPGPFRRVARLSVRDPGPRTGHVGRRRPSLPPVRRRLFGPLNTRNLGCRAALRLDAVAGHVSRFMARLSGRVASCDMLATTPAAPRD
ncbi:hypothetical protein E4U53_003489 [Claviceps sorghi]|nr:hypothetical protein E4U53_003489 [Claviceps sorghi]